MARIELFIPESSSLKTKRRVLRSALETARNRLNVSVAEVGHQDLWQRAAIGVSCVSESTGQCRKVLQEVEKSIARNAVGAAEIIGVRVEVVGLEDL